jgi:DNA (cytosine-5)-methyltransferase 1
MRDRPLLPEGAQGTVSRGDPRPGRPLILTGGPPCQDLSIAGKQAGLDGTRSILWRDYIQAVRTLGPDWIVWENVAHTWRRWVPTVRGELAGLGYASLPLRVRASDLGAPHERARIFLVAHADSQLLRKLSRWWCGPGREVALQLVRDGEAQHLADANGAGLEVGGQQPSREEFPAAERGSIQERGWWAVEPDVGRVAYGVPSRVDRIKSLGNALVPFIPQIIARGIKEVTQQERQLTEKDGK